MNGNDFHFHDLQLDRLNVDLGKRTEHQFTIEYKINDDFQQNRPWQNKFLPNSVSIDFRFAYIFS